MELILGGATGLVGAEVLKLALKDSEISKIRLILRREIDISHPKIESVLVKDFSELSSVPKPSPSEIAICSLGTTIKKAGSQEVFRRADHDAVLSFAKFCSEVSSFAVVSAAGANPNSTIFYNRVKGETEKALIDLNLKRLVIFQPGLLVGVRSEERTGEKIALGFYHLTKHIFPRAVNRAWATEVPRLASALLREAKSSGVGVRRIAAREI